MVVEFIGAAGVGKSFLAERLLHDLNASGTPAKNFDTIAVSRIAPSNLWRGLEAAYLALSIRPQSLRAVTHSVRVLARYSIRRHLCEHKDGIHVTSEGLFHRMITLYRRSNNTCLQEVADKLFSVIQPPHCVIVLEASPQTIFARRFGRRRAGDVFTQESVADDVEMIKRSVVVMERVRQIGHPALRILRVEVEDEEATKAVSAITRFLQGSGRKVPSGLDME